jgi:proteasome activator subunit 4
LTTAQALSVIASLASALVDRKVFPAGGKHLVPLLDLAIAGLDVNDPHKTLATCLFFCHVFLSVTLEDLTHPDLLPDTSDAMDTDEGEPENALLRNSTAGLPDIVERLVRAILAVCDNLPEPGKHGKTGGRMEESMINSLTVRRRP